MTGFRGRLLLMVMLVAQVMCRQEVVVPGNHTTGNKERVRVVLYDPVRGYLNWLQEWFRVATRTQCSTECVITDDKTKLEKADVVIFHGPTHGKRGAVPKRKNEKSVFAFLSMEQPKYNKVMSNLPYLTQNFDLMVTYSLANTYPGTQLPNMPITYYPLNIVPPEAVQEAPRAFSEKNGYGTGVSVVAFVSNCKAAGATQRAQFLEQLMKLVPVHSYGGCLNNRKEPEMPIDPKWPPIAQKRARKIKVLSNYKFYLAFENSPVEDYVSEKVFESLFAGAVPIYRGAPRIERFMPSPKAFINANSMTPNDVAALVKSLSADEARYNEYLAYKNEALTEEFKQIALNAYTHPNVMCRLCEYAQQKKHGRNLSVTTDTHMLHFGESNASNPDLQHIRWEQEPGGKKLA